MTPVYFDKFPNIALKRDDQGILEMRLHTDGEAFRFSARGLSQIMDACYEIGRDRDNRVVILTGTGELWCGEFDRRPAASLDPSLDVVTWWDVHFWESKKLLQNLLDIEVPMIAAVNGPALIHSEYILTCDIVLAAEDAAFQDLPHLNNKVSPTDGVHVLWPHVLGPSRGRYFLMTQQKLSAKEALSLGVCQEVLPRVALMDRAYALAHQLVQQPPLTLRYARVGLTQHMKKLVVDEMALGLAVQGLSAAAKTLI